MTEPTKTLNFFLKAQEDGDPVCRFDIHGASSGVECFDTGLSESDVLLINSLWPLHSRLGVLFNNIVTRAYMLGLQHGRDEGDILTGAVSLPDQMPVPSGTFARLIQESGLLNRDQDGPVDDMPPVDSHRVSASVRAGGGRSIIGIHDQKGVGEESG